MKLKLLKNDDYLTVEMHTYFYSQWFYALMVGEYRLLDESVKENINRAHVGLLKNKIDEDGNLYDVCGGLRCPMEAKYYIQLGKVDNDDHGTSIISALCEIQKLYSA